MARSARNAGRMTGAGNAIFLRQAQRAQQRRVQQVADAAPAGDRLGQGPVELGEQVQPGHLVLVLVGQQVVERRGDRLGQLAGAPARARPSASARAAAATRSR